MGGLLSPHYVATAERIARLAHKGATRWNGDPYITHPARVVERMMTPETKATAWLHDTLEDTSVTVDDLRAAGIPEIVIDAVVAMTHLKGESYFAYIIRLSKNAIARAVKLGDLPDNMSDLKPGKRLDLYRFAQHYLLNFN